MNYMNRIFHVQKIATINTIILKCFIILPDGVSVTGLWVVGLAVVGLGVVGFGVVGLGVVGLGVVGLGVVASITIDQKI